MAEFKDVIKQQKRMCDAMVNCGQCPLIDADCACRFSCMTEGDFDSAETEMIERIVMDWAAKNPAPRYPTWKEWQDMNFSNNDALMRPCIFGPKEYFNCEQESWCEKCMEKPIPADVAEKLGVKPIGGVSDENA